MNKIRLIVISTMLLLMIGTVSALAEPSLTDIMNDKFGTGNYHEITSTNVYKFTQGKYVATILVDNNAGNINPTGWYTAGNSNPSAQHELYSDPASDLASGDVLRNIAPAGGFGLYISSGDGNTYFSEPGLNPDKSDPIYKGQHVKCFMIDSGPEKGAYVLGFEDTNSDGGSDWDYQDVVVELKGTDLSSGCSKLVAAFSACPTSGKVPLTVKFRDMSKGSPSFWKWSFGDGTYSTTKSPVHKYRKAGKYTVSLTVKNAKGSNTKTIYRYITVKK